MKKLFLILLLISTKSFASGKCHQQKNPIGYDNYDICEVEGTGHTCVSIAGKPNNGISCFPTLVEQDEEVGHAATGNKAKFSEHKTW